MFSRIVVAVGDDSTAEQLQANCARLAAGTGAEVLFCTWPSTMPVVAQWTALHAHERDLLQLLVEDLTSRGIRAHSEHRVTASGRIAQHLLDAAAEFHADLVIVATGQSRWFGGRSQRRLVQKLLTDSACPVLVLPRRRTQEGRLWRWWPKSAPADLSTTG